MHRYSLRGHGSMLRDTRRVDAYARALAENVSAGDVVVEIGTGTGLFAILACRAGAKIVYAIESDDVIELARENAAANGCADRVVFLQDLSTRVELPERADVLVSDVRGVLPFFESGIAAVIDARTRFLAPGGRMIPAQDRIRVAAVEASELHADLASPWREGLHGVSLAAAREAIFNTWTRARLKPTQVVTSQDLLATIDYVSVESPGMKGRARLVAGRATRADGFALWFETTLAREVSFTTSPLEDGADTIYGHAFFPWPEPLALAAGDTVEISVEAAFTGGDYVWRWDTRALGVRHRQSTFLGEPLSVARMRRRAADFEPALGEEALIDLAILESMRAGGKLGDIASGLQARHPARFARWEDALARVGDVSERYSS